MQIFHVWPNQKFWLLCFGLCSKKVKKWHFSIKVLGSKKCSKSKTTWKTNFYSINLNIFRHKRFENWSKNGGEMAGFCKTLNLNQICQINVLAKCDENCLKSISKQNHMKNKSRVDQPLWSKKMILWSKSTWNSNSFFHSIKYFFFIK